MASKNDLREEAAEGEREKEKKGEKSERWRVA